MHKRPRSTRDIWNRLYCFDEASGNGDMILSLRLKFFAHVSTKSQLMVSSCYPLKLVIDVGYTNNTGLVLMQLPSRLLIAKMIANRLGTR
jgi:hypothetical protein